MVGKSRLSISFLANLHFIGQRSENGPRPTHRPPTVLRQMAKVRGRRRGRRRRTDYFGSGRCFHSSRRQSDSRIEGGGEERGTQTGAGGRPDGGQSRRDLLHLERNAKLGVEQPSLDEIPSCTFPLLLPHPALPFPLNMLLQRRRSLSGRH